MFGMGPWELIIIFAIVLLLFGGKKLPSIASGLGGAIKNFKGALREPEKSKDSENLIEASEVKSDSLVTPSKQPLKSSRS